MDLLKPILKSLAPFAAGREHREDLPTAFKRLIICCDGTWQSSVTAKPNIPSNVTQLSRSLAPSGLDKDRKTWQQIIYYDAGVGTGSISQAEKNTQGATGRGLDVNIIEAYNFLVNNYVHGDEIFFFGFSRGAFTVRATAGLVCRVGILRPAEMRYFPKLYDRYKSVVEDSPCASVDEWWAQEFSDQEYIKPRLDVPIKAIGVWDTVAALGLPIVGSIDNSKSWKKTLYHRVDIHPRMHHVFQALALDERRGPFSPLVLYVPPQNHDTTLVQVWFPGMHINVGGGDPDGLKARHKGDHENLAHISLAWMVDRVSPFLDFDHETLLFNLQMKDPGRTTGNGMSSRVKYASGVFKDSIISVLLGRQVRAPGEYSTHTEPPELMSTLGRCNEYIHPSVYVRQVGLGRKDSMKMTTSRARSRKKMLEERKQRLEQNLRRTPRDAPPVKSKQNAEKRPRSRPKKKTEQDPTEIDPMIITKRELYNPRGLKGFIRRPCQAEHVGYCWIRTETTESRLCHDPVVRKMISIPEFVIPPRTLGSVPSMERLLIREQPWAHALLRQIDMQNGIDHGVLEENEEGERVELMRARKWSCKTMAY